MISSVPKRLIDERWLSVREAAARIGRSERTVRQLCEDREIDSHKIHGGRVYRIAESALERWLQGTRKAAKPVPQAAIGTVRPGFTVRALRAVTVGEQKKEAA